MEVAVELLEREVVKLREDRAALATVIVDATQEIRSREIDATRKVHGYGTELFKESRALIGQASTALGEFIRRQAEWSLKTFGHGSRRLGIVEHVRKELAEVVNAKTEKDELGEWIDVMILALDGAWRTGATPAQIVEALRAKQAKNEARKWPDWRTKSQDEPIEHDRTEDGRG